MVLATQVKSLVEEYVDFTEKDFSATQLTYTWRNVKFKSDLLQKLDVTSDFPIYVKDSAIGKIYVSISYSLYITIEIDDVFLLCVPNSKEQNAKQMDTYCDNLLYKLQQSGSWGAYLKTGLAKYLTQGLKIMLRNVNIRYVEVEPAGACVEASFGFLDVNYSKQKTSVALDSSNLFIQTSIKSEERWDDVKLWQKNLQKEGRKMGEGVLSDTSLRLSMTEIGGTEATELSLALGAPENAAPGPLLVRLRATQLRALVAIQDTWRFLRVREVHWQHRPPSHMRPVKGKCHLWWRYAFEVVRETKLFPYKFEKIKRYRRFYAEYIQAFKVLNSQKDEAKAAEALAKLRQLTRVLNRTSIVLAREEALTQMLDEGTSMKESLSDEDFDENKVQVGDLKVNTKLADIHLCLYEKKTPQLRCVMKNLAVGYQSKPLQAVTTLSLALGAAAIEFNESGAEQPSWLSVMAPVSETGPLLNFCLESLLTEPGSQRVDLQLRRTRAYVYQPAIACLLKALSEVSSARGSTAIAKASLSYTGQLVGAVLPSRSRLSWDLDVHNPELVLPEWGSKDKDGAVIYCDLGHLKSASNAQRPPQMSAEVIDVNFARLKGIQMALADSKNGLESLLKEKKENFFLRPTNIDVQLLNMCSGRQRLELDVETLQLHVDRLTDFCRVLVHASFLGGPPMVPRDWALQQRLEVELREVFTCPGATIADLRDLAVRVSESRPKRRQSRVKAVPRGRLQAFDLASFRRRRKEGAAAAAHAAAAASGSETSRALVATELEDLQTERNPLCWEAMLRVRRWGAEVALGGQLALRGAELRLECGKLQFGLAGLCEAGALSCSWSQAGKTVNFLKERRKDGGVPLWQMTFIDLQPTCPRFDLDYGSVRTTAVMRMGCLELQVAQSAIVDLIRSTTAFYEQLHDYITEVPTSVDILTKEISNAITDLIRRNDDLEEKKIKRQATIVRFHTDTRIQELTVTLTDSSDFVRAAFTDIRFEARVERTCGRYTLCLNDCFVQNLRAGTLYRNLLRRSAGGARDAPADDLVYASVRRRLLNKEAKTWATHAEFLMNRVDIICVSDFVGEVHIFAAPFANAVTAFSLAVQQRARSELERMTSSQSRLNLRLHMPSPRFLLPISAKSKDLFILQLGDLRVGTNQHGAGEEESEAFKVKLDSVRFARSLYDGSDVLPCIDILLSNQLARVSLERRPVAKELEVVATMFHIEPKITPQDYRMLLQVLEAWKSKEGRQQSEPEISFVENVTVDRESYVSSSLEETWTFRIKAEFEGFDLFVNDCLPPPRGLPLREEDLVPFGRLELSKLSLQLAVDSGADTKISAEWEGLVLRDTRDCRDGPTADLISIANKKVKLQYRTENEDNFVNLQLADVNIYADFLYFRTFLSLFQASSRQRKDSEDETDETEAEGEDQQWEGADWSVEVTGANLNVHCASEVVAGNVEKRFLDVLFDVHEERCEDLQPWKFYVGKKGYEMAMTFVMSIDFGYVDSLFCHVLDLTHVNLRYSNRPDDFESNVRSFRESIELKVSSSEQGDDPHIGLNLSPLLVFHVRKVMADLVSPIESDAPPDDDDSSSDSEDPDDTGSKTSASALKTAPKMSLFGASPLIERKEVSSLQASPPVIRKHVAQLQSTCGDVVDSAPSSVHEAREVSEAYTEPFAVKDADENLYVISPDKLPAVKNMPIVPSFGDQEMMIEVDPIRLRLHMNINDPVLRLDLAIEEFIVKNWRSQIALEIKHLQVAMWSFNDREQDWEALVEKIAKEEFGVPFEATDDAFYMWSCSVLLYQQPSRILGDQVLEELMEDAHYHAITRRPSARIRRQLSRRERNYLPTAAEVDLPPDTDICSIDSATSCLASHDGSVDDLARALDLEMCYYLVINPVARWKRNRHSSRDPLLINFSPNTLKRTTEITQCLMALMDPELALPDKRLVPTLHIVNDTHFGVEVEVDAKGQVLELERCILHKKERKEEHLSRSQTGAHTYKLCIKVKGFECVNCRVGRHSRQSILPLRPQEAPNGDGAAVAPADDHILVQTSTDLALATVRLTSRYFVENKLQLPLLLFPKQGATPWEVAARSSAALPLGTSRFALLAVKTEGYEPIECDFHQETSGEIREMTSSHAASPSLFLKLSVTKEIMHSLVVEASIRVNNHLPYGVEIGFPDADLNPIVIPRNHHIYLPMFSGDERLNITVTVLYYQRSNWRAAFVFKASSSRSVRRLVLEEVPGSALAQGGFRTGRKITIATRRSEEHETRSLHLFAPLWIVNDKTDLNMLIKEEGSDIVRVPPSEEPALLTPLHVGSSSQWHHCKIRICVITPDLDEGSASARWSEAMDVGAVTKTVAITVPKIQKVRTAANGTDGWMVLAKIEQLGHLCSRALTVLPRYILQNRSRRTLCMTEDGVGEEGEYELPPGVTKPFWPRGTSLTAHLRMTASGERSKSFAYNIVQSTAIRLDAATAVTVDVTGGVDLSPVSVRFKKFRKGDAPLRVENLCRNRTVFVHQKGCPDSEVPAHKYVVYFWDNPAATREIFCVAKGGCQEDCECQKKFAVEINSNKAGIIGCGNSKVFWISFIHDNQRTLLITHKESLFKSVKSLSQAEPMHVWFQLRVEEVGVSLVHGQRELAYLSISGNALPKKPSSRNYPGFFLMYQCSRRNRLIHVRVSQLRLFSCLRHPVFREVIYDRPDEQQPFLDFGMKWRVASQTCGQALDSLRVKLSTIIANLDFGFVMSIYGAFMADSQAQCSEAGDEPMEPKFKLQSLKDVVKHADTDHADEYLIRNATMDSFKLRISLSGDGKVHGAYDRSVQVLDILAPLVGSIFRSKDTQLTVSSLTRCGVSMPLRQLGDEMIAHCQSELMRKVYILLLGVDILGDPLTLFYTVSEGFRDAGDEEEAAGTEFASSRRLSEAAEAEVVVQEVRPRRRRAPRRRVIASMARRGRRAKRVMRHVCGGVANSVARVTCAVGHIASKATFDPAFVQERRERFHRAVDPSDCGREACISLVKGLGAGAFGVVYRPIKGGRKAGFGGAVRGLGRGVIGVPTRPSVGLLDFISLNADAVKKLALHDQIPFPTGRRPRAWVQKTFSYYSDWEAKGQAILFAVDEGHFYDKHYAYRAHVFLGSKRTKAVFVTDKSLLKVNKFLNYKWRKCWEIPNKFITSAEARMGQNPKANNESQMGIFVRYEKNPGNGREKRIFLGNGIDYLTRAIQKVMEGEGSRRKVYTVRA